MSDNPRLNYYLTGWDLSHPRLLTQTMTSRIYTVTYGAETVILKLLSPSETEEQRGAIALCYFDGCGAVRLLRSDEGAHLLEYAAAGRLAGIESIYLRSAALAERLLSDPREVRVLHGDIHHRNIRQSARGWLAFDPKGLVGERTYDCANTLYNPEITKLTQL
jgi:streptomycin 6-kinase